jgi:UDP:flavonoid glycosyltransferase YjiC (YdhE family)
MRALASGLPLVAVPMGRDQDAAAVRIVHRGLGLRPKRTPTAIAAAVNRVLTEPSFRTAAEGMATRLRQEVAADGLRVALEDLARVSRADTARSSDRVAALP